MQVQFGLSNFAPEWTEAVVCIGTFDGVHLGHAEVISRAVRKAKDQGLPCCLVTFDRHPAAILKPSACPPALSSLESRLASFEELGVAVSVILAFDHAFSEIHATEFLDEILIGCFKAKQLVVGHDFAMGKGREGDAEWLRARISTEIVAPFEIHGKRVSSSLVRKAVEAGDLEEAEALLGRPFQISGIVISGDQLGRTLGYPTANIARASLQITPPDGVYAGCLEFLGETYDSAVSIGTRPSVGGSDRRIEAYCLDYSGREFYGESCRLSLTKRIRGQEIFDSLEALTEQIRDDVETVRETSRKQRH